MCSIALRVGHRQRARQRQADRADVGVGLAAERVRAAAEHLAGSVFSSTWHSMPITASYLASSSGVTTTSSGETVVLMRCEYSGGASFAAWQGRALVGVGVAQQRAFGEQRGGELQAHRHRPRAAVGHDRAARHRERRQPGQRAGDRVVVHQVHRDRIALGVEAERRRGGGRRRDDVAALERAREVLGDPRARLLRLDVVGVVVAGRERVGADQDAPLHLGPEARRARALVHLADVRAVDAQAVAHAVEAREVRRASAGAIR